VRRNATDPSVCECVAALEFQLTFPNLTIEDFPQYEDQLVSELAAAFGVDDEQVRPPAIIPLSARRP